MRRFILLLVSLAVGGHAVEEGERARLHQELPDTVHELATAQQRLTEALTTAETPVPPALIAALAARRTSAEEWQRQIENPVQDFAVEKVDQFAEELRAIEQRLGAGADLAEQLTASAERWPHCSQTAELTRFRAFLRTRLVQALNAAAGGQADADDELLGRQQRRHELLLQVLESLQTARERWAKVPVDTPALLEYRSHCQVVQAAMERGLTAAVLGDEREIDRDEAILSLLEEQVQLVQSRLEQMEGIPLAADAPAVLAFTARQEAEHAALQALIAHQRLPLHDEAWNSQEDRLREVRNQCAALSGVVGEWIGLVAELPELRRNLDQRLSEHPTLRPRTMERWNALDAERTTHEAALGKALAAADRPAAVNACSELEITRQGYDLIQEDLDLLITEATQDQTWAGHAADPGVAAAVKRLLAARAAFVAARATQREQELAARRAQLARRLAEIAADDLRLAADRARTTVDQLREELDRRGEEAANAVDNPAPAPEKDANF